MSTAVVAQRPTGVVVDNLPTRLRRVYPCAPWFTGACEAQGCRDRHYSLNETSGTVASDDTGWNQDATYVGSPTLAQPGLWTPDDRTNYSVDLNGTTQYLTFPSWAPVLASGRTDLSLEAIVQLDTTAAVMTIVFVHGAASAGQQIYLKANVAAAGSLRFGFNGSDTDTAAGVVTTATPYHVVAVFDANLDESRIYVNGVLVATGTSGPYTGSTTPTCNIGRNAASGTELWDGRIDEVVLYSAPLTAATVLAHAEAAGLAPSSSLNGAAVTRSSVTFGNLPYTTQELPVGTLAESPDLVEGSYTLRVNDAGETQLTFPNTVSSDGVLWRERFDVDGHKEFLEIWRGDRVDAVMNVTSSVVDRGKVVVRGVEPWNMLRKAYEPDRDLVMAPQDVIAEYGRVWVPVLVDDFDAENGQWSWLGNLTGGKTFSNGAVVLSDNINPELRHVMSSGLGEHWTVDLTFRGSPSGGFTSIALTVQERSLTSTYSLVIIIDASPATITFRTTGSGGAIENEVAIPRPSVPEFTVRIRQAGRWSYAYMNGVLIGVLPTPTGLTNPAMVRFQVQGTNPVATLSAIVARRLQGLFTAGGSALLPGDYPPGGLSGRYYNNQDLQGFSSTVRRGRIFTPGRASYLDRIDSAPNTGVITIPPTPGSSGDYFSVRWFGAIYLRGDLGDYQFRLTSVDDGARLWVGETRWGEQLLDDWADGAGRTVGPATKDSTVFGDAAGWVPIILEYHDGAATSTIVLEFNPPGAGTYTDPGGGTVTRGSFAAVPSTSLSPLGCVDQRIQGQSHFDVVQQVAGAYGYQVAWEPLSAEDSLFPGMLVSAARIGVDTDVVLRVDTEDLPDAVLGPSVETDSTDQATSLSGGGAGLPDGRNGQVQGEVIDTATLAGALYDQQAFTDASDITSLQLLRARLDAELALRSAPWQNVSGVPRAQERLADTFPVTGVYALLRWRPGDGVRLNVPDIGLADGSPRQIVQVTRGIHPYGRTSAEVSFRQRPKSVASTLRRIARSGAAPQRSYQRQKVMVHEFYNAAGASVAAGAFTGYLEFGLLPSDQVVGGRVRIAVNSASQALSLEINGTNVTTALGGTWSGVPVDIDIIAYVAIAASDNRFYVRVQNSGASPTIVEFEAMIEVLR